MSARGHERQTLNEQNTSAFVCIATTEPGLDGNCDAADEKQRRKRGTEP
jgi:hypothetical protein